MDLAAWLAQAQIERRALRQRIEQALVELNHRAQRDPSSAPLLALQIGAMEQYSNALGYRIAEAQKAQQRAVSG